MDVAAIDQSRPSATRTATPIHPMRSMRCIFIPHLGKIGLAYFSPSECEVAHTLRGIVSRVLAARHGFYRRFRHHRNRSLTRRWLTSRAATAWAALAAKRLDHGILHLRIKVEPLFRHLANCLCHEAPQQTARPRRTDRVLDWPWADGVSVGVGVVAAAAITGGRLAYLFATEHSHTISSVVQCSINHISVLVFPANTQHNER